MESRNGARLNELSLSISDRFRRRDVTYEALRINGRKGGGKKGARGPGLICRNKLHRKKCKIECRNASPVFLLCPCNAVDPAWRGGLSGVSSGQDENVGSFNVSRGGWQREREKETEGEGGGPGVIYEVSKTLYTPTRQRAGLAPRNPVLALTHRYLSHDHFRPIRAHAALHTGTRMRSHGCLLALDVCAFTIYSAPRVDDAVGYLVDIVYLGGGPLVAPLPTPPLRDPRDFSS